MADYISSDRSLDIRAKLSLPTGRVVNLTASDIISYKVSEESAGSGFALGEAASASYEMRIDDTKRSYSVLTLSGARVEAEIGIQTDAGIVYSPLGVWAVESAYLSKQSATATLKGSDALALNFNDAWKDIRYPTTVGTLAEAVCASAGVVLKTRTFLNSDLQISKKPEWPEDTTNRGVISYIAACAGGFARMNRVGELEIVTYNAPTVKGPVTADVYMQMETGDGAEFKFNTLGVKYPGKDEFTRFTVAEAVDTASNTLQIDSNPLLTSSAPCIKIKDALKGLKSAGIKLNWVGDPSILPGDRLMIHDLDGTPVEIMVNQQDLTFNGGLRASTAAALATEAASSSGYSVTSPSINSEGMVSGTKIVTGSVTTNKLAAGSITTEKLAAGSVTTDILDAESVTADKLAAGSITAEKIEAGALDALIIEAVTAAFESLTAGDIETSKLYAAFAHIVSLAAGSIDADKIETDVLAAQLAEIADLRVKTANIDYLHIIDGFARNIFSDSIEAGKIEAKNLVVREAQILDLMVGAFRLVSKDGKVYKVTVGENGELSTEYVGEKSEWEVNGKPPSGFNPINPDFSAGDVVSGDLYVTGDSSFMKIIAKCLNADEAYINKLFATDAVINTLKTYDIRNDDHISLTVGGERKTVARLIAGVGFRLGEEGTPYTNTIAADGWEIAENGMPLITCSENKMKAPRVQVTDALLLGNSAWKVGSDGHVRLLRYGR